MEHKVKLFVGPLTALRPFSEISPLARVFLLTEDSPFPVLPLTEALHEALHGAYGTGDWLAEGPLLTTTDMAFAAKASRGAGLAYVETDYAGGVGQQCAALWRDGALALGPAVLNGTERAATLWPVNMVLKALGVASRDGVDEILTLGLAGWGRTADIVAAAREVAVTR